MVDPIKGCAEIDQHDLSIMHTLQCTFAVYMTHTKVHHRYPDLISVKIKKEICIKLYYVNIIEM